MRKEHELGKWLSEQRFKQRLQKLSDNKGPSCGFAFGDFAGGGIVAQVNVRTSAKHQ